MCHLIAQKGYESDTASRKGVSWRWKDVYIGVGRVSFEIFDTELKFKSLEIICAHNEKGMFQMKILGAHYTSTSRDQLLKTA